MTTHASILAWEIPWTEKPGRIQPIGLQRVRHHLVTEQRERESECSIRRLSSREFNEFINYPINYSMTEIMNAFFSLYSIPPHRYLGR